MFVRCARESGKGSTIGRRGRVPALVALAFAALCLTGPASAQQVRWSDPGPLGAEEQAVLELVFEDTEPAGAVTLPRIDGLTVLGGPARATTMSIVNGRQSTSVTLGFSVRAERPGRVEIPAFDVATSAGRQRVAPLALEVGAADAPTGGGAGSDAVRARLAPSTRTPYAGEVVDLDFTVTLDAGRRGEVDGTPSWDKPGTVITEPWSAGEPVSARGGSGVRFRTRAVAPRAGTVELPPVTQDVQVETGRRRADPFDAFGGFDPFKSFGGLRGFDAFDSFFSRPELTGAHAASDPVRLDVRPLPQPAPAGFSGAVGQFRLESALVPSDVKAGDPVTWTVTLSGTGNWPDGVALPARAVPSALRALQPKQRKQFDDRLFTGSLSEDLVLVPTEPGNVNLEPVRFVYFDPDTERYETAVAQPPTVHVTGTAGAAPPKVAVPAPASSAPAAAQDRTAPAGHAPREPMRGASISVAPLPVPAVVAATALPFVALAAYGLMLALRRARLGDPNRRRREAYVRLKAVVASVRRARDADERIAALLAWQHVAATVLGLDGAAPTAAQLRTRCAAEGLSEGWVALWAESEHGVYGRDHALPPGWCGRALAVRARVRRPRWNPLRAFLPGNLLPRAAATALLLAWMAAPALAEPPPDAAPDDATRTELLTRVQAAPLDWIARYNLGLVEAQRGAEGRALAETAAAFVQQPRDAMVRGTLAAFATQVPGIDPGLTRLVSAGAFARSLPAAGWQALLSAGATVLCLGAALVLRARHRGAAVGRRSALTALAGVALIAAALFALRQYGPLASPDAAMVAEPTVLRSVPTEVQPAEPRRPVVPGTVVVTGQPFLGWVRITLASGETGWVRHAEIVPLYAAPSA